MDHVAFFRKGSNFLNMILAREKTIESRWYKTKRAPWGRIHPGETIYFKNAGEPITAKATIQHILQITPLDKKKIHELLETYGKHICFDKDEIQNDVARLKDKNYCILLFLENPERIKPFTINKKGFGNQAAWITVPTIKKIQLS